MGFGITIRIWGEYACFTRPELKVERVSYDIITPTAAKGIIEAIYWKPAINWIIDKIHVIKPIQFTNIRRNEVSEKMKMSKINAAIKKGLQYNIVSTDFRHQRAAMILKDVEYVIQAHFELNPEKSSNEDTIEKHYNISLRRLRRGQYFSKPFLGTREFGANYEFIERKEVVPKSQLTGSLDLGFILYSLNYSIDEKNKQTINPSFFRAKLNDGILDLAKGTEVFT